jgi:hypothetical protein
MFRKTKLLVTHIANRHWLKSQKSDIITVTMYGLYTPVLILQAICAYHAYRNNAEQRWFWLILLFPFVGCLIYLYHHFYSRDTVSVISENVKEAVYSNYRIEQLERALRVTDNVTNRINLADAYVQYNRFDEAVDLYRQTLTGFMKDDPTVRMKLLKALYVKQDFADVIALGTELESEKTFFNAEERIAYAWALHHQKREDDARKVFQSMDKSFTNYQHRLEYCKYLKKIGDQTVLKEKAAELLEEFSIMKGRERKMYKHVFREVEELVRLGNKD